MGLESDSPFSSAAQLAARNPPPTPSPWRWECHVCHRIYRLGVTRRCLIDGHVFCAGITSCWTDKGDGSNSSRRRRRSCTVDFDYIGWQERASWRRVVFILCQMDEVGPPSAVGPLFRGRDAKDLYCDDNGHDELEPESGRDSEDDQSSLMNCWTDCEYPNECRWAKLSQGSDWSRSSSDRGDDNEIDAVAGAENEKVDEEHDDDAEDGGVVV